jgi:Ca-activated chloride channel family protein
MSDDLNDLKAALRAATPAPDPARKAENLALARKNFDRAQGSASGARLMSEGPKPGPWTGVRKMLKLLSPRAALVASTALVAVAVVTLTPLGDLMMPPDVGLAPQIEPVAEPVAEVSVEPDMEVADTVAGARTANRSQQEMKAAPPRPASSAYGDAAQAIGAYAGNGIAPPSPLPMPEPAPQVEPDTESFANADANPVHVTAETPVSTFSIDVDTASYAVVRNSLLNGYLPDADAVRIEEMVNYFPYAYPAPDGDAPFRVALGLTPTPWNSGTRLLHVGIQGAMPAVEDRPALNLVFLIDTSGSMESPDKLPLLRQSLTMMLGQLRPEDQIAIVAYAGSAGLVLEPTNAGDRDAILGALDRLEAGGSTAGAEGLRLAYRTAKAMTGEGEVSRVILATDGDFNVGISDPEDLKAEIAQMRDQGTYLSVLGFGRGNLDDATMQALAQNGNGQAAYIDTLNEARKVLVDQLTGALFPIADDVKVQVEFNPAQVAEYRLIGYETRALRREDFNNDRIDAGDIGAGLQVTALYEITPVGSPARLTDPLRYGTTPEVAGGDELGFVRLRYKAPGASDSDLIGMPITGDLPALPDTGFAAAIAGFGQILRHSPYLHDWGYAQAIELANAGRGDDPFGYRVEAVQLMRLAEGLAGR